MLCEIIQVLCNIGLLCEVLSASSIAPWLLSFTEACKDFKVLLSFNSCLLSSEKS